MVHMDGKFSSKVARSAVAAGLALAMAASPVIPATVALADGAATGNITITKTDGQTTSFKGYQIFTAAVKDSENSTDGKTVSDLKWADGAEAVVESVAAKNGHTDKFATAQDGADWIKANIQKTNSETAVASNTVAYQLATALQNSKLSSKAVTAGTAVNLSDGYWLFVTDAKSLDVPGEVATAPIFAVVGGKDVFVKEKDSLPTISKTVNDNKKADSVGVGDTVNYKLDGTVANNIDTYSKYYYKFTDTLSAGLTADRNSVVVKVKNGEAETTVKSGYTTNLGTNEDGTSTLTVEFTDLKRATDENDTAITINKDTHVTVEYKATVNTKAQGGSDTNNNLSNSAKLTYSNDPKTADQGEKGTTDTPTPSTTKSYTYRLNLVKKDRDTEATLNGAVFTLKGTDGKYIKADGSKTENEQEAHLTTDENGAVSVNGLDEGTYTLHEVTAPTGYDTTTDTTIKITPTIAGDDNQTLTAIDNQVTGNDDAIPGQSNGITGDHQLQAAKDTAADVQTGTVTVTVGDKKEITMPLTGMKGTTALVVYGSAVLVISAAAYIRHRRNAADSE